MNLERPEWGKPSKPSVVKGLTDILGDVNAAHPFREGNGRTQRAFIDQLAQAHGIKIDWSKSTQAEMRDASIDSINGRNDALLFLIRRCTTSR